jgi:hypothetical protein
MAYLRGELRDELAFDHDEHRFLQYLAGESAQWTMSEVSLHGVLCATCAQRLNDERTSLESARVTVPHPKKVRVIRLELPWRAVLISSAVALLIFIGLQDNLPPPEPIGDDGGASILIYRPGRG